MPVARWCDTDEHLPDFIRYPRPMSLSCLSICLAHVYRHLVIVVVILWRTNNKWATATTTTFTRWLLDKVINSFGQVLLACVCVCMCVYIQNEWQVKWQQQNRRKTKSYFYFDSFVLCCWCFKKCLTEPIPYPIFPLFWVASQFISFTRVSARCNKCSVLQIAIDKLNEAA